MGSSKNGFVVKMVENIQQWYGNNGNKRYVAVSDRNKVRLEFD